jgi:putative tricarboxylic transport membrane protein
MDVLHGLYLGFSSVLNPHSVFFCFFGVLIGTLVGVLPGLGPVAAISLLLPTTFHIPPLSAIIMLAGIYYGAQYGGSTTSILVNIPGEASSVVTCLDGYQMARKGRAGPALGIAACGSFIAGTIGVIGLTLVAPPLAEFSLKFGPPEYFSLMVLGLSILAFLASGPMWKALIMAGFGIFLGSVGMDLLIGAPRFTYNIPELSDGLGLVPVVMGLFGVSEVLINVEKSMERHIFETEIKNLLPNLNDWKKSYGPILRGGVLGFFLGTLPGGGAIISSFVSYAMEKKISKHPEKFGTGMIEGVAGPESANNSATAGAFIPLLTLGIPANSTMAILLGAMMIYGVQPGPLLFEEFPQVFWGTISSMYIGNIMLLVLNLPLIGLWVRILKVPYPFLFPMILLFCLIGSYSINNSIIDVLIMITFGIIGYLFKKLDYECAPLVLAFVLGPMMEENLRRSLLISGSPMVFLNRPISIILISVTLILFIFPLISKIRRKIEVWGPKESN